MSTLPSTPVEPDVAAVTGDRTFRTPPPSSPGWRRRKERGLNLLATALRHSAASRRRPAPIGSSTGILTYHHVAKQVTSDPHLLNVTPVRFRGHIEGLLGLGYQACSLRDVIACHRDQKPLPEQSFVVVFDDGHHSVYENAWPVLKELGVPATIFLATEYLDRDAPLPFDACQTGPARCGDTRRPLTTLECQEMLGSGLIDLGSHTHSHEDFRGRPNQFSRDLTQSLHVLGDRFGLENATFSFPYGRFDAEMQEILRQHDLLCALTAECRCVTLDATNLGDDRMEWGRFGATQFDTPRTLAAKLDGWYTWLQQHWRRLRG
jgi:peptidoglycan/xylan/chitin deacetylase (PgdA/CDA1 family)